MSSGSRPPAADSEGVEIRDAACVVLVDDASSPYRLLMGRRHSSQVFLPNKWVFPGGRVDSGDRLPFTGENHPTPLTAFIQAAVRELEEETGLRIASPGNLTPLARAITPPGRVRRYDTWFFIGYRADIASNSDLTDGELLDLGWFSLIDARRLDIPNITKLVLEDAAAWLASADQRAASEPPVTVPFYFEEAGLYQRGTTPCV